MGDSISKVIIDAYKNDGRITDDETDKIKKCLEDYPTSDLAPTGSSQFIEKHADYLPDFLSEWAKTKTNNDQLRLRRAAEQITKAVNNNNGIIDGRDDLSAVKELPFEVRELSLTGKKAISISTFIQNIKDQPFQARVGELVRVLNSEERRNDTIRELAWKAQSPYFTVNTDPLIPKLIEIIKEKCSTNENVSSDKDPQKCVKTNNNYDLYDGIAILLSKATPEKAIHALEELTAASSEKDDPTAFLTFRSLDHDNSHESWSFRKVLQNSYEKVFAAQIKKAKTGNEPIFSTLEASLGDRTKSSTYQRVLSKTLSDSYLAILRDQRSRDQLKLSNPLVQRLRTTLQSSDKSPEERTLAWSLLSVLIKEFELGWLGSGIEEQAVGWKTIRTSVNDFYSESIKSLNNTHMADLPTRDHRVVILNTAVGSDQSKALLKAELIEAKLHEPSLIIYELKDNKPMADGQKTANVVLSAIRGSYQLTEINGDYFDSHTPQIFKEGVTEKFDDAHIIDSWDVSHRSVIEEQARIARLARLLEQVPSRQPIPSHERIEIRPPILNDEDIIHHLMRSVRQDPTNKKDYKKFKVPLFIFEKSKKK